MWEFSEWNSHWLPEDEEAAVSSFQSPHKADIPTTSFLTSHPKDAFRSVFYDNDWLEICTRRNADA